MQQGSRSKRGHAQHKHERPRRRRHVDPSLPFTATEFVYNRESESEVRGLYEELHPHREPLLTFAQLYSEALSQTADERWFRPMRETRVTEREVRRWQPPSVTLSDRLDSFSVMLVREGASKDLALGVTFELLRGRLVPRWFGVPDDSRPPNLFLKSASSPADIPQLARENMRMVIGFLGRFDPQGQACVDGAR